MSKNNLEEIAFKYERLQSLIGVMQLLVAEVVEIAGAPDNCLANALYEVEIEMKKNNEILREAIQQKGGVCDGREETDR